MNGGSDSMCRLGQFPTAGDKVSSLERACNWQITKHDFESFILHSRLAG